MICIQYTTLYTHVLYTLDVYIRWFSQKNVCHVMRTYDYCIKQFYVCFTFSFEELDRNRSNDILLYLCRFAVKQSVVKIAGVTKQTEWISRTMAVLHDVYTVVYTVYHAADS